MKVKLEDSRVCLGCRRVPYYKANCLKTRQCNMSHVEGFKSQEELENEKRLDEQWGKFCKEEKGEKF